MATRNEEAANIVLNCLVRSVGVAALDHLEGIHKVNREKKVDLVFTSINKTQLADKEKIKTILKEAKIASLYGLLLQERKNAR